MAGYKNNDGFTFISVLLALSILIILLPFATYLLQSITFTSKYDEFSIMQFFYFVRDNTTRAKDYHINENKITFKLPTGEKATISQYGNSIRRQVDNKGHEIYLRDIKTMNVDNLSYGFKLIITTIQGEQYEKSFTFYQ